MNNNFQPLVSIVIPVYNGSNFLAEAIESALGQTYSNCEVIVVNDGSSDEGTTRRIALLFNDRIRYFEKENGGAASALNLGIRNANGEYISWLSHDDLYFPEKIEHQITYLRKLTNKNSIIYSDYEFLDIESNAISKYHILQLHPNNHMQNILLQMFKAELHGCSILLPKKCFDHVAFFDESLITTHDYDLWFKLIKSGYEFRHIPEILVRGRQHKDQVGIVKNELFKKEIKNLYNWASDEFYDEILRFPSKTIMGIITLLKKWSGKKSGRRFLNKVKRDKPILYCKLLQFIILTKLTITYRIVSNKISYILSNKI